MPFALSPASRSLAATELQASLSLLALLTTTISNGDTVGGVVTLTGAAPAGGVVVSLKSSNAKAATPSSVTIPSGSTQAGFLVTTSSVVSKTSAVISAKLGTLSKTANLTITPTTLGSLELSPNTVLGGDISIATVAISNSNPSVAQAPASVQIPAGTSWASFNVVTDASVTNTSTVIAAYAKGVGVSQSLTIQGSRILSLTASPTTIFGGNSAVGTITLSTPATSNGSAIALSTS